MAAAFQVNSHGSWLFWDKKIHPLLKSPIWWLTNTSFFRELDEPHLLFLKQKMTTSTVSQIINCLLWCCWHHDQEKAHVPEAEDDHQHRLTDQWDHHLFFRWLAARRSWPPAPSHRSLTSSSTLRLESWPLESHALKWDDDQQLRHHRYHLLWSCSMSWSMFQMCQVAKYCTVRAIWRHNDQE